jgi:hypothetical protein
LHNLAKRLFKEVLLTLLLFNSFNISYSAGIHFIYESENSTMHLYGSVAAVASLIVMVLMAIGLLIAK